MMVLDDHNEDYLSLLESELDIRGNWMKVRLKKTTCHYYMKIYRDVKKATILEHSKT